MDLPFLGPPGMQDKVSVRFKGAHAPRAHRNDNGTAIDRAGVSIKAPIFKTEQDTWSVSTNYDTFNIDTDARLPSRQDQIPESFKDVELGLGFNRKLTDTKSWMISASVGSASDQPFADRKVTTVNVTGMYSFEDEPTSSWIWLFNYSNNRPFLNEIPLPGFAYTYRPSKQFIGVFGIPFVFTRWEFVDKWYLSFVLFGVSKVKLEIAHAFMGPFQAVVGSEFDQTTFKRKNRFKDEHLFFYAESKVYAGLKAPVSDKIFGELLAGYAFDRSFYEVESFEKQNENKVRIENGPYLSLNLSARF